MRILTVLPFAAHAGGPGFDPIAEAVAAETIATVLAFAKPETCLALADNAALATLAEGQGLRTLTVAGGLGANLFELPPEAGRQLRAFAKADENEETAILFVNPFNPLLTPQRLASAVAAFLKAPDTPLVSVKDCRDHPCQFQRYLRHADIDALHLLDHAWSPGPEPHTSGAERLLASRPFSPHRLERHFFPVPPGTLVSYRDGHPLDSPEDGLAVLFQPDGLARLVFEPAPQVQNLPTPPNARPRALRLAGMFGHLRHTSALFEDVGTGQRWLFFTAQSPVRPSFLLRLIPFSIREAFWDQAVDLVVPHLDLCGPMPEVSQSDIVGYIVCVFGAAQGGGEADMPEVFAPPTAPWVFRNNRPYNSESGCAITGRQAFPRVVHPDGSLLVLPLNMATEGNWSVENAQAYPLPDEESLIVADQLDYLRLLARRQANASSPQAT